MIYGNLPWPVMSKANAEKWVDAGVDGIMLVLPFHEFDRYSEIAEEITGEMGIRCFLHLFEMNGEGDNFEVYTMSDPKNHEMILKGLEKTGELLRKRNFDREVVMHAPWFYIPKRKIDGKAKLSEMELFANSKPVLERMREIKGIDFAIENMPASPAGKQGIIYGRNLEQLKKICGNDFGMCIDVGHAQISETSVEEYIDSGIPVLCAHIHGNGGVEDEHKLPYKEYVDDKGGVGRLLEMDIPISIEIKMEQIETPISELKRIVESLNAGELPEKI